MADQVNPIGSVVQSAPAAPPVSSDLPRESRAGSEKARPAQDQVSLSTAAAPAVAGGKPARPAAPTLDEAAKALREFLKDLPSDLQFKEDQDTGHLYFKVVNPVTQEVIRQVPSEEVLAMARKLKELADAGKKAPGVLLDQQG